MAIEYDIREDGAHDRRGPNYVYYKYYNMIFLYNVLIINLQ